METLGNLVSVLLFLVLGMVPWFTGAMVIGMAWSSETACEKAFNVHDCVREVVYKPANPKPNESME